MILGFLIPAGTGAVSYTHLYGPYQIARALKEDKVEIPAVHMAKKDAGLWKGRVEEIKDPYGWGSSTVAEMCIRDSRQFVP